MSLTFAEFANELQNMARRLRQSHRAFLSSEITPAMREGVSSNFTRASTPDGTPWEPTGQGHPILIDSGALFRSLSRKATDSIEIVDKNSITIGTKVKYAAVHNFGSRAIPAREFMGLPKDSLDRIESLAEDYIESIIFGK